MSTNEPILFYRVHAPYGCFSNFSPDPVHIYGLTWPTSEHAFQSRKFEDFELQKRVLMASTPRDAANIGRNTSLPLRPDWETRASNPAHPCIELVKDRFMHEVVLEKFRQNPTCQGILLGTGDSPIIEDTTTDTYWGWGTNHTGKNKLGKILEVVRDEIRREKGVT